VSSVADPECLSRIPDPDFSPSQIPDPGSIEELRDRREGKGRLWFFGYLMQLEGEGKVIVRQSFKKRLKEIWWNLKLGPSDNWLCTLPLENQDLWKKNLTYIWWTAIQLKTFLGKRLKLNGESAKKIMTTFAFRYVSYLLYARDAGLLLWIGLTLPKEQLITPNLKIIFYVLS